jgi:hypothetical protein
VSKGINTVNSLASAQEIYAAIPKEGIDVQVLAQKFEVDGTNFHLFIKILKKIANLEVSAIVKPRECLPSEEELEELEIAAKEAPAPRILMKNQIVWSRLLDAPTV